MISGTAYYWYYLISFVKIKYNVINDGLQHEFKYTYYWPI